MAQVNQAAVLSVMRRLIDSAKHTDEDPTMAADDAEECRQPSAINLSTPRRTPEHSEHSDNNVSTGTLRVTALALQSYNDTRTIQLSHLSPGPTRRCDHLRPPTTQIIADHRRPSPNAADPSQLRLHI
ncbi:hypothetical protein FJT64_014239 [Amphibalanus amphitrite]|uniref:Uncharacterized protein n=1 Tax=Amphibalanus amphitrite TaxID=1232801 RepID=A0A6A4V6X6_AMPAM|nr:hypothetical protein FJT64_014239 [Amphibalanus amphitrite]